MTICPYASPAPNMRPFAPHPCHLRRRPPQAHLCTSQCQLKVRRLHAHKGAARQRSGQSRLSAQRGPVGLNVSQHNPLQAAANKYNLRLKQAA